MEPSHGTSPPPATSPPVASVTVTSQAVTTTTGPTTTTLPRPVVRLGKRSRLSISRQSHLSTSPPANHDLLVELSCSGAPCAGTISLSAVLHRRDHRAAVTVIASGSYSVQAGHTSWVAVPLTLIGEEALGASPRAKRLHATASVALEGGRSFTATVTLR
jgi:hypothetical protein